MKERKIIKILTNLNLKERKSFLRYVSSPYFNTNQKLTDLLVYIYQFAPNFDNEKLTIENAFAHLFRKEVFSERIITRLISKLFKLIEEFIALTKHEEDSFNKKVYLLEYYFDNQLTPFFDSIHKKMETEIEATPFRDDRYFYNQFLAEFHSIRLKTRDDRRDHPIKFDKMILALDIQYWIRKLNLLGTKLNHQTIVDHPEFDNSETKYVLKYLEKHPLQKIPAIKVCYSALELLNDPKILDSYLSLKKNLSQYHTTFPINLIQHFYTILINNVPNYYPRGTKRMEEYFNLFSEQIEQGYIYTNGYILPQVLKNVMTVSLRLKKYTWAESFLENNREYIYSNEVYSWNLSALLYEKGDYEKALDLLTETKYDDIFYLFTTKRLLIKIYYRLGYEELLHSFINTFRVFISRKKLAAGKKEENQQFLNYALKLIKLKGHQQKELKQLLSRIEEAQHLAEKYWLIEEVKHKLGEAN